MNFERPEKCIITNLPTHEANQSVNGWCYDILIQGEQHRIIIDNNFEIWQNEEFYLKNKHLIAGAILNRNELFRSTPNYSITISKVWLQENISKIVYPKQANEKIDFILQHIYKRQTFDGEIIRTHELKSGAFTSIYYLYYLRNMKELMFYIDSMIEQSLIWTKKSTAGGIAGIQISVKGLTYLADLHQHHESSKNCFIAMSFSKGAKVIRETIRNAVLETGFTPVIIDEQHIDSDQTINDAIIAELKKAKFCIADFSEQKKGVYFESGFALGQGKKVIYCCSNTDFNDTHFDTNHFAHILYDNHSELETKLVNKIEAWIK